MKRIADSVVIAGCFLLIASYVKADAIASAAGVSGCLVNSLRGPHPFGTSGIYELYAIADDSNGGPTAHTSGGG